MESRPKPKLVVKCRGDGIAFDLADEVVEVAYASGLNDHVPSAVRDSNAANHIKKTAHQQGSKTEGSIPFNQYTTSEQAKSNKRRSSSAHNIYATHQTGSGEELSTDLEMKKDEVLEEKYLFSMIEREVERRRRRDRQMDIGRSKDDGDCSPFAFQREISLHNFPSSASSSHTISNYLRDEEEDEYREREMRRRQWREWAEQEESDDEAGKGKEEREKKGRRKRGRREIEKELSQFYHDNDDEDVPEGYWRSGLFTCSCNNGLRTFLLAFFLPCVVYAQTNARVGFSGFYKSAICFGSFAIAFLIGVLLVISHFRDYQVVVNDIQSLDVSVSLGNSRSVALTGEVIIVLSFLGSVFLSWIQRRRIREVLVLSGGSCVDFLIATFCYSCSLTQVAMQVLDPRRDQWGCGPPDVYQGTNAAVFERYRPKSFSLNAPHQVTGLQGDLAAQSSDTGGSGEKEDRGQDKKFHKVLSAPASLSLPASHKPFSASSSPLSLPYSHQNSSPRTQIAATGLTNLPPLAFGRSEEMQRTEFA